MTDRGKRLDKLDPPSAPVPWAERAVGHRDGVSGAHGFKALIVFGALATLAWVGFLGWLAYRVMFR